LALLLDYSVRSVRNFIESPHAVGTVGQNAIADMITPEDYFRNIGMIMTTGTTFFH